MPTFTIEVSRALRALGVEKETFFRWVMWEGTYELWDKHTYFLSSLQAKTRKNLWETALPAFCFTDIIEIMHEIGEKKDWEKYTYWTEQYGEGGIELSEITVKYHSSRLLDAFMEGGYEKAETALLSILNRKDLV